MKHSPRVGANAWVLGGLCLLTTATGSVDATSFLDLGRTFTANMTGNVLLLAFSLTGADIGGDAKSQRFVIALVAFVLGALLGAVAAGRRGRPARLPLGIATEIGLLGVAFLIAVTGSVRIGWRTDVVVSLLALAMGVQNAMVRRMGIPDANTTVLTTSLGSLAADVVAVGSRPPRAGRRLATISCLFLGAGLGALLQRNGAAWALGAGLLLVVAATGALTAAGWPAPSD